MRYLRLGLFCAALTAIVTGLHAEEPKENTGALGVALHLDTATLMNRAIRQVGRLVDAHPNTPVKLLFLSLSFSPSLYFSPYKNGGLYGAQFEQLLARGVRIFACETTLMSMGKSAEDLTFGIETVPSGIAELARLQLESGYAYLKL